MREPGQQAPIVLVAGTSRAVRRAGGGVSAAPRASELAGATVVAPGSGRETTM